ncbi:hypothetical protein [Streptomyces sp. WAC 04229]|uniref:RapZ C-terminal domain-containing protein n=1 Tax=Streptomyces sp. WAC 04229 TaxID=2203206 RepID=UPI0037D9D6F7
MQPATSSISTASAPASKTSSSQPPGARELLANLADYADLPAGPSRIAIGCAGGRHRASGLTELLARELRDRGREVVVEHLHVRQPRVLKTPACPRTANTEQETAR